jgi:uncharacterized membrane protein
MLRLTVLVLAVLVTPPARVAQAQAQEPMVYGVFFFSQTCPHCHEVLTEHWPSIQEQFGSQLQVLFVDINAPGGSTLMQTARYAMNIDSNGVPMLIIGTRVMIGSVDIPRDAPEIIRAGLAAGGIGYPPIVNIEKHFQTASASSGRTLGSIDAGTQFNDPANVAAVAVLLGAVIALAVTAFAGWQRYSGRDSHVLRMMNGSMGRQMALIGVVMGIILTVSLALGSFETPTTLIISTIALAVFILLGGHLWRVTSIGQLANWLILPMIFAGLLVAGYLAMIETTQAEATCGIVGNCNAVNQSAYAQFLGIPVAVIGIVGYLTILALWVAGQVTSKSWIDALRFIAILLGVGFSVYLTFVEPFVLRESCVWCLTSAVLMVLLLWMNAPAGLNALISQRGLLHPKTTRQLAKR